MKTLFIALLLTATGGTSHAVEFDPVFDPLACRKLAANDLALEDDRSIRLALCLVTKSSELSVKAGHEGGIKACAKAVKVLTAEFERRFPNDDPSTACKAGPPVNERSFRL